MSITFTASPMSKPYDLSLKASLAWDYYRINNGGWCCAEADNGDGGIIVTDEARILNDAFVFPDCDAFAEWLEDDAEQKLKEDPADYLCACGVVPDNLLSDAVVQALLATINDPANAPEKPSSAIASAEKKLQSSSSAATQEPRMQDYYVTFAIDGRYTVKVEGNCLDAAKDNAQTFFEAENFGELEFVDSKIIIVEDEQGNFVYER